MNKYAAATALAIGLITTLALAVSASVTPANARRTMNCGQRTHSGVNCTGKCETELWNTAKLWDGTRNPPGSCPPLLQACVAKCVAAGVCADLLRQDKQCVF
jgi:hypothetical protein